MFILPPAPLTDSCFAKAGPAAKVVNEARRPFPPRKVSGIEKWEADFDWESGVISDDEPPPTLSENG